MTQQPTPDMGVGSAGNQATGFDASTATANPAGMTRLDRSQMEGGIMGPKWGGPRGRPAGPPRIGIPLSAEKERFACPV